MGTRLTRRRIERSNAFLLFVCLLLVGLNRSQGSDFALFKEQRVHPTRILAKYRSGIAVDSVVGPLSADGLMVRERYSLVPGLVLFDSDARSLIEMRQRILEGVVPLESLIGKTLTGGRLNAYRTLNAAPDGLLELTVSPGAGPLLRGSVEVVRVSVSDFAAVTDAVVVGSIPGLDPLEFRNDGTGPDGAAGDGVYSAEITVPDGCMTEFFIDDERSLVRAPHQGEASWTAVVLYRFWVARTVPASRVAGKGDLTTDFTEDHG